MTCGMEHGHGYGHDDREHAHGGFVGMKEHHCCPVCGESHGGNVGFGAIGEMGPKLLVKKATKKLLMEKIKAKIDERWGEKLDVIAQEMVDMADEKMKLKKEMWKRKEEMKHRMYELLVEGEEE